MSLSQEERSIVVGLELEKADKFLAQADAVSALGIWDVVANRIFYAAFHAVSLGHTWICTKCSAGRTFSSLLLQIHSAHSV